jgi:hypothetical protein
MFSNPIFQITDASGAIIGWARAADVQDASFRLAEIMAGLGINHFTLSEADRPVNMFKLDLNLSRQYFACFSGREIESCECRYTREFAEAGR